MNQHSTNSHSRGAERNSKAQSSPMYNQEHEEGTITKTVEEQTSKIPSIMFLALAGGSMALAFGLAVQSERKGLANFVGLWAPTFLLLGIYNKIVKTQGSDMHS